MRWFNGLVTAAAVATAAGAASADVVTQWNQIALDTIVAVPTPPPRASRALAMVHSAVYDAVNSIDGTHFGLFGNFSADPSASREAAAICAAHDVLVSLYPTRAAQLNSARDLSLAALPDNPSKIAGVSAGESVASAVLAARSVDGSGNTVMYTPNPAAGHWRIGPDNPAAPLLPHWGSVQPFAMNSGSQFRPAAPPALTSPEYAASVNQVKEIGALNSGTRTADQTSIARAWAFGSGTVTPPGAWNQIAQDLSGGQSISENARMFAMLNVAMADAGIASWDAKYHYDLWRPIHAIREAGIDGNDGTVEDPNWLPLLTPSPPFPTYTSGHSTFSRAAADVLAFFLGTDSINVVLDGDFGEMRLLTSLDAAANEAGLSRIYGGIHFDFDNVAGQWTGANIADWVASNYFLPVPAPSTLALLGLGALMTARRRR
jgi:hypothetical protein